MKSFLCLLIIVCSVFTPSLAQPKSHIEHYSLTEGLPQRSIMNIIQDRKGFIWLATWDGLCKFDGYDFITYKTSPEDSILMRNNRIDKMCEDTYGYIWLYTYNREPYRFDPKTEKYVATFKVDNKRFKTSKIITMPSGKVWLASETMGAICVLDTLNTYRTFSLKNNNLPSNKVFTVYEETNGFSWILTDSGLLRVSLSAEGKEASKSFFCEKNTSGDTTPFYSVIDNKDEIWFGSNKGRIWCYSKDEKKFKVFETGVSSEIICIKKIYDNLLIILTSKDGFIICDKNKTNLKKFNRTNLKELPTDEMISCFIDGSSNIWFEMNYTGVAKFNLVNNQLNFYKPVDYRNNNLFAPYFFIVEDKSSNIWVHPHGGFSFYDKEGDKLLPFFNDPLSTEWRFSDMLHDLFLDMQGNLWLSTRTGGLEKVVFNNTLFRLNDFCPDKISSTAYEPRPIFEDKNIRSIFEDTNNNIWIGNMNSLISVYDKNRNLKGFLCDNGTVSKTGNPIKGLAYTFHQDKEGNIWIGTKGNGIYVLKPLNNTYASFEIKQYKNNTNDKYSLSNDAVYFIHEDKNERIWVGTYGGGINLFDRKNGRFINNNNSFDNYPIDIGNQIRTIQSSKGKIYVGTTLGLIVFSLNKENMNVSDFKTYSKGYKIKDGLKANDIYSIHVTKNDDIYIATFGGGMCKVTSRDNSGFPSKFKTYDNNNGLRSDIVLSIKEDNNDQLWVNSEGSLSRFDQETESFEQFNDASRAISNQYFTEALPLLTSGGELIYGCTHGTLSFSPDQIIKNDYIPYLALTKFKVSNNDYPLKIKIDDIGRITLSHKENIFGIEYAALDYTNPHGISYAYMLEGFDKEWIIDQKQRIANYTNIPPGEYIFKVKSTNSNGTWVDNERRLLITITPSFWQTKWAYLLYFVSFILALYGILRSIFVFYRMKDKVLLEQEQTEMKTRFFTDISHEIRTPLTMIVSPIENILDNEKTHFEIKPQLQLILSNANRMLKMVNQILDFRKIQKQRLQLKEVFIGNYIQEICNSIFNISENQGIRINVNNFVEDEKIWIDLDSIEKLLSNLISNAIKHASGSEKIEINIFRKDKMIALQVKDEGKGMTKEILNKLFTRFASYNTDKSKPSTGIGLSIVKEVADKHHARIAVESDLNNGSSFTVLFQTGLAHFSNDEYVEIIHADIESQIKNDQLTQISKSSDNTNQLSILIVEDDYDLRNFIKSVLSPYYLIFESKDGKEGYETALKQMPDFILSDIMMPEVDGIEFLQKIRINPDTSHIPFILLTAKTSIDDKMEGITLGADDYMTKPFSVKLLIAKINNIIRQRKRFSDYLAGNDLTEPKTDAGKFAGHNKITEQDELFIKNMRDEINNNLDNSDFTIDDLVKKNNLSRRVFFNKVKSLTGVAPIEFVRELRIREAAKLLKTQQYRIKEVTYMVGFCDIRYFTQCFKDMFGMTPSQYKEQFKNE